MTRAPASTNARLTARPNPPVPPATKTTLPGMVLSHLIQPSHLGTARLHAQLGFCDNSPRRLQMAVPRPAELVYAHGFGFVLFCDAEGSTNLLEDKRFMMIEFANVRRCTRLLRKD